MAWEIATAQAYRLVSLFYLGHIAELSRRLAAQLREAESRGDLYAEFMHRISAGFFAWLAADDPASMRREIDETLARWSREGFQLPHFYALVAQVNADLYEGQGAAAWGRMQAAWPTLRRSLLMRLTYHRILAHWLRAKCALAAAESARGNWNASARELFAAALKDAARIEAEGERWSTPLAVLLRAGVSVLRDDREAAARQLEAGARGCDEADQGLYAAIARRHLGALTGGDAQRAAQDACDSMMRSEGIVMPERWIQMLTPGFGRIG